MASDKSFTATIVTPAGVPLGGDVIVHLFDDGRYAVQYHMHCSSVAGSFDFEIRAYLTAPEMPVLFFYHQGHISGVGDYFRGESGHNPVIQLYWTIIEGSGSLSVSKSYEWDGVVGVVQDVVDDVIGIASGVVGWTIGAVIAVGDGALGWTGIHIGAGGTIGVIAGVVVFAFSSAVAGVAAGFMYAVVAGVAVGAVAEAMISTRTLDPGELDAARQVFGEMLPYDRIRITNLTSVNGAMFTLPGADGLVYCNLGRFHSDPQGLYPGRTTRPYQVLIHELTHALQIDRAGFVGDFLCNSLDEQVIIAGGGTGVYQLPDPAVPWSQLTNEQQAVIVDHWYEGRAPRGEQQLPMDQMSPYYGYIWYEVLLRRPSATAPVNLRYAMHTAVASVDDVAKAPGRLVWHNRMLAFWIDASGAILTSTGKVDVLDQPVAWNGAQPFQPAGTATQGVVSAVSRRPGRVDVFWIDPTGGIGWSSSDDRVSAGAWKAPVTIVPAGNALPGALAAIARNHGRMDLYWIGPVGEVRTTWWDVGIDTGVWHSSTAITMPKQAVAGALAAVSRNPQQVDLFWVGPDGGVGATGSSKFDPAPHFPPPRAIAPPEAAAAGALAAVARTPFQIDVFWLNPRGVVITAWWTADANNDDWNGPREIAPAGTAQAGAIAALARSADHLDVFWIQPDGAVASQWFDARNHPAWNGAAFRIASSGDALGGLVTAVSVDGNRTDVLWKKPGAVSRLSANWWHGGSGAARWHTPSDV
jgi:hypothetical protein